MAKKTRYGQQQQEQAWLTAEVDALYRLAAAEVRAPRPHGFIDGVLLMDMIVDADGDVAPRLDDVALDADTARAYYQSLLGDVVKMLCAGLIHGDLSEFNVLEDAQGPVIIDLPQAVDAAGNNSAEAMFKRDVNNMRGYFARFAPALGETYYAEEIWALYEAGELHPDSPLTGEFTFATHLADVEEVLDVIDDAKEEEAERLERLRDAEDDRSW